MNNLMISLPLLPSLTGGVGGGSFIYFFNTFLPLMM